ncbi:glutathione S-transferase [Mesorhizobium sp. NBSH29]|uniref:glutathione S-transferase family protein n=1 Tax=Mesorhizobium sp. NBSH29 TaxID=2654249 RepID=UPI001896A30C|nr:glutathione S-transferase family protein [Mesorhizobium sp. NBSH29]QPC87725.1 glutathione S-transferase [Mesorhizobium sp. NBSH29]
MLKFYHAPFSRSFGVFWLLAELGIEYEMVEVDIHGDHGAPEQFRQIQPSKKVPAIDHNGSLITERAAITIYLAEAFPQTGLAPAIGDPDRAKFLTWNVYCDSVFDPVLCARAHDLVYRNMDYPFGLFDDMVDNVERHLEQNEFAAGSRFTAADTHLGSSILYTMDMMKLLPERPAFRDYANRMAAREAYQATSQRDYGMAIKLPHFQKQFGSGQAG